MPKVFFQDTGLRNALLKNFQDLGLRPDVGALVENAIFANLYKNSPVLEEIHFWRTQSRNEVDFVLYQNNLLPIEVKFRPFTTLSLPSGLRSFTKNYRCDDAVVLMQDAIGRAKVEGVNISFLPVWVA